MKFIAPLAHVKFSSYDNVHSKVLTEIFADHVPFLEKFSIIQTQSSMSVSNIN